MKFRNTAFPTISCKKFVQTLQLTPLVFCQHWNELPNTISQFTSSSLPSKLFEIL